MRSERRQPLRSEDPAHVLVDTGLIDVDFVAAQLGRSFASSAEAARAVVAAGDVSPHPLFESSWIRRKRSWQRSGLHPVVWYVAERRRRNRLAPHPLVDPRIIFATHPEARFHEYGALAHWLSVADASTPLPTRILPRRVTWGTYRTAAIAAAQAWRDETVRRRPVPRAPEGSTPEATHGVPTVSIVMPVQDAGPLLRTTVTSLQAQSFGGWELIAVDRGSLDDSTAVLTGLAAFDDRISVVTTGRVTPGSAVNTGLTRATGEYVVCLTPGRALTEDHLAVMVAHARATDRAVVSAGAGVVARSHQELLAGRPADLATTLLRRDAIDAVGGADESLEDAVERDLMLRLCRVHDLEAVDVPVLRRPDPEPTPPGPDWESYVLERQLVDWSAAEDAGTDDDIVTIVLPLGAEPRRTVEWLSAMPREGAELIAVGTRLRRAHHILAGSVTAVVDGARLVSVLADVNLSTAVNVGLSRARGSTVLVVRPGATPPRRPITRLLADTVADPEVALAQPLIVDTDGVVLSGGARFAPGHPHPALFLAGLPSSDARRIGTCTIAAPASPIVAIRTADAVALRGLDCRFRGALSETDLGLRARAAGLGATVLVPEAEITSRGDYASPDALVDAFATLTCNRAPRPPDESESLLRIAGFEVTDERNRRIDVPTAAHPTADPVLVPEQVIRAIDGINESPPRLRWALDIASPAAPRGDRWGDTHFARSLADALERRGQQVSVDRQDARHRDSRDHDDVLLVLRGLDHVRPRPGLLNLEWIISHPDMITPQEVASFDQVYAASLSWSARMSAEWGVPIEPLLQCTDVRWFHPDRAEPDSGPEVLFVGNSRGVYRYAVRTALAIGAPLTLHGNDWTEFVPRALIASNGVANEEVGALYAAAGIVLNDHHLDMRRDSFPSNRLFDAAACGARVASDVVEGLQEIFEGLVQPFRDEAELARLINERREVFPDDEQRRKIAAKVVAEHSFDRRAETLVDDAVRRLRARGR